MGLLAAEYLLAESLVDVRVRVGGGRVGGGVVYSVGGVEAVARADVVVKAGGAEVFADFCGAVPKYLAMPVFTCAVPAGLSWVISGPLATGQRLSSCAEMG